MSDEEALDGSFLSLKELADLARRCRDERGDTQEDAAARLNVRQSTVSDAESGDTSYRKTLFKLVREYAGYEVDPTEHYQIKRPGKENGDS